MVQYIGFDGMEESFEKIIQNILLQTKVNEIHAKQVKERKECHKYLSS